MDKERLKEVIESFLYKPEYGLTVAVGLAWIGGLLGLHLLWSLFVIGLAFSWERNCVQRILRNARRDFTRELANPEFPQTESAQWVNAFVNRVWRNEGEWACELAKEKVTEALRAKKPSTFQDLYVKSLTPGTRSPELSNIKSYKTVQNEIRMDMTIFYDSDLEMVLVAKVGVPISVLVKDIFFKARARIWFKLMPNQQPFVSLVRLQFIGQPTIDVGVHLMEKLPDIFSVPGLELVIKSLIVDKIVRDMLVYPNAFELNIPQTMGISFATEPFEENPEASAPYNETHDKAGLMNGAAGLVGDTVGAVGGAVGAVGGVAVDAVGSVGNVVGEGVGVAGKGVVNVGKGVTSGVGKGIGAISSGFGLRGSSKKLKESGAPQDDTLKETAETVEATDGVPAPPPAPVPTTPTSNSERLVPPLNLSQEEKKTPEKEPKTKNEAAHGNGTEPSPHSDSARRRISLNPFSSKDKHKSKGKDKDNKAKELSASADLQASKQ